MRQRQQNDGLLMPPKKQQQIGFYVIFGEDPFLVSKECEKLVDSILGSEDRSMALYEPRANEAQVSDVLDELRTLPFLATDPQQRASLYTLGCRLNQAETAMLH